jgi:anti-sigma regulatory factor (Ser/Thr protein kinase)
MKRQKPWFRKGRNPNARKRRSQFRRKSEKSSKLGRGKRGSSPAPPRPEQVARQLEVEGFDRARRGLPLPTISAGYFNFPTGGRRRATILKAPARFSVAQNRDEVLGFLYAYRSAMFIAPPLGRKYGLISIDLGDVVAMGLGAALVVTAEYHRALLRRSDRKGLTIDDAGWPSHIRGLLEMLGFYDLVEAVGRTAPEAPTPSGSLKFVQFVFAEVADGEFAEKLIEKLRAVGGETPDREAVYAALIEAILNVTQHAYPDPAPSVVPRQRKWWAAGSFNEERQLLEFVVYDQGVGIPNTLPKRRFFEAILTLSAPERTDADLIEGAIEFGRTSTEQPERGNGLWTICSLVKDLDGSIVRIHSGRGQLTYDHAGKTRKTVYANPFCGTLIQWSLRLPSDVERKAS